MLSVAIGLLAIVPALAQPLLGNPFIGVGSKTRLPTAQAFAPNYADRYATNSVHRPNEAAERLGADQFSVSVFTPSGSSSHYAAPAAPAAAGGFTPEQLAFMERQRAVRGESSFAASASAAPATGAGGFSPEQLAFMERQNTARGGASSSYAAPAPVASSGGYSKEQLAFMARRGAEASYGGSSWDASPSKTGRSFSPRYAPAYAPLYSEVPQALDALAQTSPDAVSLLAATLIGALVGAVGVTFAMRFRRSASTTLNEPLVTVSN